MSTVDRTQFDYTTQHHKSGLVAPVTQHATTNNQAIDMTTYVLPLPNTPATSEKHLSVAKTIQTKSRDPSEQCCYPSKRCENPCVVKSNGELHRFCDEHRARANLNQRRLVEQATMQQ